MMARPARSSHAAGAAAQAASSACPLRPAGPAAIAATAAPATGHVRGRAARRRALYCQMVTWNAPWAVGKKVLWSDF